MRSRLLASCMLMLASSLPAAADSLQESSHWPLLARDGRQVTIAGRFADPVGIASITLEIITGPLGGCHALMPCRQANEHKTYRCTFEQYWPKKDVVSCVHYGTFTEQLVTYCAEATTGDGRILRAREVTFAVTDRLHGDWSKLPVLWHSRPDGDTTVALNFARAQDYGDDEGYYDFLDDLGALAEGVFHGTKDYARLYARALDRFDLWLLPQRIHLDDQCHFEPSFEERVAASGVSANIVLHKRLFRDCAEVYLGGNASVYGGSGESPYILVHETGHCVFGLADEYACGGWHDGAGSCRNLFDSLAQCTAGGKPCEPLVCNGEPLGRWRLQSDPEIMKDAVDSADWRNEARRCVEGGLRPPAPWADSRALPPEIERKEGDPGRSFVEHGQFPQFQVATVVSLLLEKGDWSRSAPCRTVEVELSAVRIPMGLQPILPLGPAGTEPHLSLSFEDKTLAIWDDHLVVVREGQSTLTLTVVRRTVLVPGTSPNAHFAQGLKLESRSCGNVPLGVL